MKDPCTPLDHIQDVTPSARGCEDWLRSGGRSPAFALVSHVRVRRLLRFFAK